MKEMKSKAQPTSGVLRRNARLPRSSFRYFPYATGSGSRKKEMKEEVVRLGVELSLHVARSIFLLSDNIRTMLWFCATLWRCVMPYQDRVLRRLLFVIDHVINNSNDIIKLKNRGGVCLDGGNSVHWKLVETAWDDFFDGIVVLHRLFLVLSRKDDLSYDDRLLSSAFQKFRKQVLKNLDDILTSEASNGGFARETFESNFFNLWKSLFDDDDDDEEEVTRTRSILTDLFKPLLHKPIHRGILALPVPPHPPYILGEDFAKQELKEEVARLGVELSLYVAQSMFLLCDDIRSMLRFCFKLWRGAKGDVIPVSPVVERLLGAIHYVYSKHIKPKKHGDGGGVYHQQQQQNYDNGNSSVQWELIRKNFDSGIRDLGRLVLILRGERSSCFDGREFTSRIEGALNKVDDTLRCAKPVSEAKGFAREAVEPDIWDLWKSLFDKEAKQVINHEILGDLFLPLCIDDDIN